ncbi:MAG: phenylalanine--tRNA ligase subunit beta [Acidimicrobiaceae bacterium]|nr:phenylalanine--tRNA ligase subunit beta [Acidimicrobiaceae bacterium]
MKVLLSWLREFAPDIGDAADTDTISDVLTGLGLAVESVTVTGSPPDGVVVGKVLDLRQHPDADRIQLVEVDDGSGATLQVCCGAFNMAVGDLIPLARVGTVMPNGMEIASRKMRGQASEGMCCSEQELGLGADGEGIMILNDRLGDAGEHESGSVPVGAPLGEALGLTADVLWDLEVGANRPDALSVMGVARDMAAGLGVAFEPPDWSSSAAGSGTDLVAGLPVSVEIEDPSLCGRFMARLLRNVPQGPSPAWLAARLTALGMRPINCVVDISNDVMLELGQPSHAFDLERVAGARLGVRRARDGEIIKTLDGAERSLAAGDGVITDGDDSVISIAGVMGGASTEVSADTSEVLVEMAWWDPPSISRTAKRLNLSSEAATRFRRGADWGDNMVRCMNRFVHLASTLGAEAVPGVIDERGEVPRRDAVTVRVQRVNRLLGTGLSARQMAAHLRSIGFEADPLGDSESGGSDAGVAGADEVAGISSAVGAAGADEVAEAAEAVLKVIVPTWRWDTATETDVAEEVARLHGYENIARTVVTANEAGGLSPYQKDRRLVREVLVGAGFFEAQTMPFVAPEALAAAGLNSGAITLANPVDERESMLAPSLLPGQLRALAYNQRRFNRDVGLFEISHVYLDARDGELLPDEREHLAVAQSGAEAPAAVAVLDLLTEALSLPAVELRTAAPPGLHPHRSAEVAVAGRVRGVVGEIHPEVLEAAGIEGRVAWLQLDLQELLDGPRARRRYRPVSKFPPSRIDLAFVAAEKAASAQLERAMKTAAGKLLARVELFDVYRGPGVEQGWRGLTYQLQFQADDRTLTDAEVAEVRERCVAEVSKRTGARLRG